MASRRRALVVATYEYADGGLRRLAAPEHDAESFADVLKDEAIAGFDVTMLVNQPHYVVGEAIADFYAQAGHDDLTLLYFTGHGLKDDEGRLYLAMTNTRRDALMFTAISGAQLNDAMDASRSRRKVLILDCCYSGAFPAGRTAKADEGVQTLERFQGKGRAVLTASDATQYAFEGDDLRGSGTSSVFTRYLVDAISTGAADLDEDGDIALDELYSYVYDRVVAEVPQQRPKKQEDVDGRILIAHNVHWKLPTHLQHAIESPIAAQRLSAVQELGYLRLAGNDIVRTAVDGCLATLASDDSRSVSSAAAAVLAQIASSAAPVPPVDVPAPRTEPTRRVPAQAAAPAPAAAPASTPPRPPATAPAAAPVHPSGDARDAAVESPPAVSVPAEVPEPPGAAEAAETPAGRDPAGLALGLIVLSALPLTLARLLNVETSNPYTFDGFFETTVPWTLAVVVPLTLAALLLLLRGRLPWALPPAVGLVVGVGLVLTENSVFWAALFVQERSSYDPGPALWSLFAGWALVVAAAVVMLTRTPFGARGTIATDWQIACALVVLVCAVVAMATVSEADTPWVWIENNAAPLVLGVAALGLTLFRLRADQAVAGLVAVAMMGFWVLYFLVQDYVQQFSGIDPATRRTQIICVVLALLACGAAQARSVRRPTVAAAPSR
jgi:hypothetical protein